MLAGAYELFCELGFRATTMDAIAQRAGVAVQTLYFTFRTKDALLQAVHDWTVLGNDATPPPMQPWYLAAAAEPDARKSVALIVSGVATIAEASRRCCQFFMRSPPTPPSSIPTRRSTTGRVGMSDLGELLR